MACSVSVTGRLGIASKKNALLFNQVKETGEDEE